MTASAFDVVVPAERQGGLVCLTMAFATDPVMRWLYPDPHQYATCWPGVAEAYGGRAFDHGTAWGFEGSRAVVLWLTDGVEPDGETVMEIFASTLDKERLQDIGGVFERMDALHPTVEHWYLPLIGVDPMMQGQGLGSALLRHGLAICDSNRVPAYLEATNPRNRDLYLRHRFDVVEEIQVGSAPPLWSMLREPAS